MRLGWPGRPALTDGAVLEFHDLVGQLADARVVRGEDEGRAALGEEAHDREGRLGRFLVELGGGLVGHDEGRSSGDGERERGALLLAAGELPRQMAEAVAEADRAQELLAVGRSLRAPAGELEVLREGQVGHEVVRGALEDVAHARAADDRSAGARSAPRSTRPTSTLPADGKSSATRRRRSVDFPLPDAPTTAVTAPAGNETSTPRRASTRPLGVRYVRCTPWQRAASLAGTEHLHDVSPPRARLGHESGDDRDGDEREDRHGGREPRDPEERPRRKADRLVELGQDEPGGREADERPDHRSAREQDDELEGDRPALNSYRETHPSRERLGEDPRALARLRVEERARRRRAGRSRSRARSGSRRSA